MKVCGKTFSGVKTSLSRKLSHPTTEGSGRQGVEVCAADGEEGGADRGGEHEGPAGGGHVGAAAGIEIEEKPSNTGI